MEKTKEEIHRANFRVGCFNEVKVCWNNHHRSEACVWETLTPEDVVEILDKLRNVPVQPRRETSKRKTVWVVFKRLHHNTIGPPQWQHSWTEEQVVVVCATRTAAEEHLAKLFAAEHDGRLIEVDFLIAEVESPQ